MGWDAPGGPRWRVGTGCVSVVCSGTMVTCPRGSSTVSDERGTVTAVFADVIRAALTPEWCVADATRQKTIFTSTRRFLARPVAVELLATGRASPYEITVTALARLPKEGQRRPHPRPRQRGPWTQRGDRGGCDTRLLASNGLDDDV